MKFKMLVSVIALLAASIASAYCMQGFFLRSEFKTIGGNYTQICIYSVNGDEIGVMYPSTQICPMTKDFCF